MCRRRWWAIQALYESHGHSCQDPAQETLAASALSDLHLLQKQLLSCDCFWHSLCTHSYAPCADPCGIPSVNVSMPQAEFLKLEGVFISSIAACLLQSRPLGCAPLPLRRAAPGLHPGLEAAIQGNPQHRQVQMTLLNTLHTLKIDDDLEGLATQGCKALPLQTALCFKAGVVDFVFVLPLLQWHAGLQ